MDLHDISRTALTYKIKKYYVVNRLDGQKKLYDRITGFWNSKIAEKYNKDRVKAFSITDFKRNLNKTLDDIKKQENVYPYIITTTAQDMNDQVDYKFVYSKIRDLEQPVLIVFGTGNGLAPDIHKKADCVLKPIKLKNQNFNHLSVRSAVAIILDRLISEI